MGACYRCGGEGWVKRVVTRHGSMPRVSVRNGLTRSLAMQFLGRSDLCPVCQGKGVPAGGNYPVDYLPNGS